MAFDRLWQGVIDTFLMVGVSSLIALVLGIPLAVILVTSGKGGIYQAPTLNKALGAFVNLFRSIPFLILTISWFLVAIMFNSFNVLLKQNHLSI